jgi:serine/threonine protein kinase
MASPRSSEFWKHLDHLFNQAMDLPPGERQKFIDKACANDTRLRAELESLLRSANASENLEDLVKDAARDYIVKAPALKEGARVGVYEIKSLLGAGGMGRVYLGYDTRLRRKVAIKTVNPEALYNRESLRRFDQEALAASALNHPNILTIYEVGEAQGQHFIASEFVDGPTLREKLTSSSIPLQEALSIAIQAAAGITAAHAAGIVHRDIKPENILVRKDGIVKIVDFGIAKLALDPNDPSAPFKTATRPGVVLGTPLYMSPEQKFGVPVDARTDVYSLGAVLNEMVAEKPPLKGADRKEIYEQLLKGDPIPRELALIIARATQKERENRYQTAQEFRDALQAYKADYEFRAKLHDSKPGLPGPVRPGRNALAWAGLLIALLVLLAAAYLLWKRLAGAP